MATSSIGHDIHITDKKEAKELVEAMERAEKESKNMDYDERLMKKDLSLFVEALITMDAAMFGKGVWKEKNNTCAEEENNVVIERRLEVVSEKKKRKIEINLSEWESVILSGKGTVEFK